ncbi:hypothetical protein F5146DRAFT_1125390 [Armillaria mellea]|nr:hypothetical protein F5146DRAFT_1125390 [Armillaria mellea]
MREMMESFKDMAENAANQMRNLAESTRQMEDNTTETTESIKACLAVVKKYDATLPAQLDKMAPFLPQKVDNDLTESFGDLGLREHSKACPIGADSRPLKRDFHCLSDLPPSLYTPVPGRFVFIDLGMTMTDIEFYFEMKRVNMYPHTRLREVFNSFAHLTLGYEDAVVDDNYDNHKPKVQTPGSVKRGHVNRAVRFLIPLYMSPGTHLV